MTLLAHIAAALLYVSVGWWAGRERVSLPLVASVVASAVALAVILCGGAP